MADFPRQDDDRSPDGDEVRGAALLLRYCEQADDDSQFAPADLAELTELLEGRPDLRRLFVQISLQRVALGHILEYVSRSASSAMTLAEPDSAPARAFPHVTFRALAASIALVAVATYGSFIALSWNLRRGDLPEVVADQTQVDGTFESAAARVIESGIVEVELKQGTKLVIEGPAEWKVDGENQATLNRGKLLATVPKRAIGFTVVTPTARVIDLGTEFGVTVDDRGDTRTRVFKGEIQLHAATSADSAAIQQPASRKLTAGQAVRIDATGSITPEKNLVASADEFIRWPESAVEDSRPHAFEAPHAYSKAVLATPGLVGYWRLGEDGTQGARDEVGVSRDRPLGRSGGRYGKFEPGDFRRPGALSGKDNCAVNFTGKNYIEIDDTPDLEGNWDGLTLAAWICPQLHQPWSRDELNLIFGKWAPDQPGKSYALFYHISGRPLLAITDGKGAEFALKGSGEPWIGGDAFSFLVGTWDKASGDCRLYINASPDKARLQDPALIKLNPNPYMPLIIGSQQADNSHSFAGLIDEVSVFNRALTTEEVRQLYQKATEQNES